MLDYNNSSLFFSSSLSFHCLSASESLSCSCCFSIFVLLSFCCWICQKNNTKYNKSRLKEGKIDKKKCHSIVFFVFFFIVDFKTKCIENDKLSTQELSEKREVLLLLIQLCGDTEWSGSGCSCCTEISFCCIIINAMLFYFNMKREKMFFC